MTDHSNISPLIRKGRHGHNRGGGGGGFRGKRGKFRSARGGRESHRSGQGWVHEVNKIIPESYRHEGVFKSRGEKTLLTLSFIPGYKVYNEDLVTVENDGRRLEYRTWNPSRCKLAEAILRGIGDIHVKRGSRVLYLGASSGITVSHLSDIVGPQGIVYAVEYSAIVGRDLISVAEKRMNIVPIIEDIRHPSRYRSFVGMVDVLFSDANKPDQAHILALNAQHYLKDGGHFIMSVKSSTDCDTDVVATEIQKLREKNLITLDILHPSVRYLRAVIVGMYLRKSYVETNP